MKNDSILVDAEELSMYLGVTKNMAYTLLHREDFPSIQIGSSLFAVRVEVDEWIRRQVEKGGYHFGKETRER